MRGVRKRFVIWVTYRGAVRIGLGMLVVLLTIVIMTQEVPANADMDILDAAAVRQNHCIDAGHGGVDGGAVSKQGAVEKDLKPGDCPAA